MKFIKFIAITRFNYIDILTIAIAMSLGLNEHYIYAAITIFLMSLISVVVENYAKAN